MSRLSIFQRVILYIVCYPILFYQAVINLQLRIYLNGHRFNDDLRDKELGS